MMNFTELLKKYPRLNDWYQIGPVQRAELESFAADVLRTQAFGITADGVITGAGDIVWVFDGVGKPVPTTVQPLEAVTSYYLFGQIPVANSFSTEQAARLWQRHNK